MPYISRPVEERFWEKVQKSDGCWIWTGCTSGDGYGAIKDVGGKKQISTHRLSWKLHNGSEIPQGMMICHSCDNPVCVNPSHLWLGTPDDNMKDRDRKGRHVPCKGQKNGNTVLTKASVIEMRLLMDKDIITDKGAAELYGISRRHACQIRHRVRWKHI